MISVNSIDIDDDPASRPDWLAATIAPWTNVPERAIWAFDPEVPDQTPADGERFATGPPQTLIL